MHLRLCGLNLLVCLLYSVAIQCGDAQLTSGLPGAISGEDTTASGEDTTASGEASITVGELAATVTEGSTATVEIKLGIAPSADVVIAIASSDTTRATVEPSSMTFTSDTYDTAQTVTLTAVDDAEVNGNKDITVTVSVDASTADETFKALASVEKSVQVVDNDTASSSSAPTILFTLSASSVAEGGSVTGSLSLNSAPSKDTVVTVTSSESSDMTVAGSASSTLTFTTANYGTAQTVTLAGVDDDLPDADDSVTLTASATGLTSVTKEATVTNIHKWVFISSSSTPGTGGVANANSIV